MTIELDDIKIDYVPISQAREMSGLRIALGAFAIPAPWQQACKSICYVKGLDFTHVRSADEGESDLAFGMGGTQSELYDWTAQSSVPVMVWNDERPRAQWNDQLYLAERLGPEPALIPADIDDRVRMFGLANELLGENGLAANKRHMIVAEPLHTLAEDDPARAVFAYLGSKYGYDEDVAARAGERVRSIVNVLAEQLAAQRAAGSEYLIGNTLSALDIYWATTCAILSPLPEELCPMYSGFRGSAYGNSDPEVEAALGAGLRDHRDFIYERYLELPMVF